MEKLLNRIAWIVSILAGIFIARILLEMWSFIGIILGLIFKGLFLSKNLIKKSINSLKDELISGYKILQNQDNTITEKQEQTYQDIISENTITTNDISDYTNQNISTYNYEKTDIDTQTTESQLLKQVEQVEHKTYEDLQQQTENQQIYFDNNTKDTLQQQTYEQSKIMTYIKNFFAENALAKIGGILIFLGVLFLLLIIYNEIGTVGRLIVSFIISIVIYVAGIKVDKKGLTNEARIIFGTSILINYAIILFLRWEAFEHIKHIDIIAFMLLFLNTVLAVVTGIVYKSNNIITFSFLFAFANPFFVGGKANEPYFISIYALIICAGALFLAYNLKSNENLPSNLTWIQFIGGNIIFLIAPVGSITNDLGEVVINHIHWIFKLLCILFISIITTYFSYRILNKKDYLYKFLGLAYIFVFLLINFTSFKGIISNTIFYISYMLAFGVISVFTIFFSVISAGFGLIYILMLPFLFILLLSFGISSKLLIYNLFTVVGFYLVVLFLLFDKLSNALKYNFLIGLGIFTLIIGARSLEPLLTMSSNDTSLYHTQYIAVIAISFILLVISYILSTKEGLTKLYSISTILHVIIILPLAGILFKFENLLLLDIFVAVVTLLLNVLLPIFNKNLLKDKDGVANIISGLVAGIIFIGIEIFAISKTYKFGPATTGLYYLALGVFYFILGYILIGKLDINFKDFDTNNIENTKNKNIIYGVLGIAISLFAIAVGYIFSTNKQIWGLIWLSMAVVLIYFYKTLREPKIYNGSMILYIMSTIVFFSTYLKLHFLDIDFISNFGKSDIVPLSIMALFMLGGMYFLKDITENRRAHDMLHIFLMTFIVITISIIAGHSEVEVILTIVTIYTLLHFIYNSFYTGTILNRVLFIFYIILLLVHFKSIHTYGLHNHFIITILLGVVVYVNKFSKNVFSKGWYIILFVLYAFVATTTYVYRLFDNIFMITIYWGLLTFMLISYGISKDNIRFRTIGFYILFLTLFKILFYDILSINDDIIRVLAFLFVGGLLFMLSSIYTKKYGNKIKLELNIKNIIFTGDDTQNQTKVDINNQNNTYDSINEQHKSYDDNQNQVNNNQTQTDNTLKDNNYVVNNVIKDIDVSNIKDIILTISDGRKIRVKSKNFYKIVLFVVNSFGGKLEYYPDELKDTYDFIVKNYKTNIDTQTYNQIKSALKLFVEKGGQIKIIYK